ncbi:MAG: retroviral-like aspartic protease family protein [Clostridium sp.]|nr:retroviral-like aspartic protease family protein [Clostridium sp.]
MKTCDVIPFSDQTFENLIFLPITVNDTEVTALFDTGAGMSFLSQSMADRLGDLQTRSSVRGGNNQGVENTYQTVCVNRIQIGTMLLTAQDIGILPDEALNFGEDSRHHVFPASMLLGWDVISQFCWKMDMKQKTAKVSPGGTMPTAESLSWDAFPILPITHSGSVYRVGFDSGHTDSFLDHTWMTRFDKLKAVNTVVHGVGSVSTEEVKMVDVFSFMIGQTPVTLHQIEIAQHPVYGADHDQICGLLGADILCGATWILDYQSRHFSIQPAEGLP